ncbi:MAG: hypothetical protein RMK84_15020 [Oscillochloridaceae bacterium]|nr:hypothetical protein [Chloroflexaceae bacterium]MDW8391435.1 hypothetical protein [Oscillochloridaceae bacterium]
MTLSGHGPKMYTIHVRGHVEPHWETELRMQIAYQHTDDGEISLLRGRLPDQAALLGILGWLAMWGYEILGFVMSSPPAAPPGEALSDNHPDRQV